MPRLPLALRRLLPQLLGQSRKAAAALRDHGIEFLAIGQRLAHAFDADIDDPVAVARFRDLPHDFGRRPAGALDLGRDHGALAFLALAHDLEAGAAAILAEALGIDAHHVVG